MTTTETSTSNPPTTPSSPTTHKLFYAHTLLCNSSSSISQCFDQQYDMSDETTSTTQSSDNFIPLFAYDKECIYRHWTQSVIIKVLEYNINHQTLTRKLQQLWKPPEPLFLIDLGDNFSLIKFTNTTTMNLALHGGPWFVFNHFISVRRWEPKFCTSTATLMYTAVWLRLPELPSEFYDSKIL